MQRFESTRPSQPVGLQRVTYEGRLKNRAVPRGFADMSWSPCAEFGNGGAIPASCLSGFGVSFLLCALLSCELPPRSARHDRRGRDRAARVNVVPTTRDRGPGRPG